MIQMLVQLVLQVVCVLMVRVGLKSVTIAAADCVMKIVNRAVNCKSTSFLSTPYYRHTYISSYLLLLQQCRKNQNQDFCSLKQDKKKSVCDNGLNTFFPGITNGHLCKFASDFSNHLPPDSCSCVPSADQECVINYPGPTEGCHVKSSADLVSGSGGSCTTCLINECDKSFEDCLGDAITTEDAEECVGNASVPCREKCYMECAANGSANPVTVGGGK